MTEAEWLTSDDPWRMLRLYTSDEMPWPHGHPAPAVSDRKLRLFACACCWGASAEIGRRAEQCAERESGPAKDAVSWARACAGDQKRPTPAERAALLRGIVGNPWRPVQLPRPLCERCNGRGKVMGCKAPEGLGPKRCPKCKGEPLPCPWLTPQVLSLARIAHDDRRDDRTLDPLTLMALADALEEASCTDQSLLDHLRDRTPHVRGCWVLDLLLGKE